MNHSSLVQDQLAQLPLVAILRGVKPTEVVEVGLALQEAGIRVMEVTMNSPEPFESIRRLASEFGDTLAIGGGTVVRVEEVDQVWEAGGRFIVSPNTDPRVIARSKEAGLFSLPGAQTCSECFTAIEAGADALKIFPASVVGPDGVKALTAVLPPEIPLFAVGGVNQENIEAWAQQGGIAGVGLGSHVYRAGDTMAEASRKARAMVAACRAAFGG